MIFDLKSVRSVQLEITNLCNAACPQCPRNFFGGRTIPTLPKVSWTWREFCQIMNQLPLQTLQQIYFCGTYGDPLMHKNIADMVEWLRETNPNLEIGIHTNGGIGSESTWHRLAQTVSFVAFGIDGLEDTNHIYRRGVRWPQLLRNVNSYINAGGKAYWDFIAFRHNQHQVTAAQQLSVDLGFKKFSVKRTSRFLNRAHEFSDKLAVQDRDGNFEYWIYLPSLSELVNPDYQRINFVKNKKDLQQTQIYCNAQKISEIYIGADGFVFPCGWLHDRMYGPEIGNHSDHARLLELMDHAGGISQANIFHSSLDSITQNWLSIIAESWTNNQRLERCAVICGSGINLIGAQNQKVTYKI